MSKPLKRPESVLVVVYTLQQEVLLLQRSDDPNFWQSITGSLDPGETPAQTAVRELREETGISGVELIDCQHQAWFDIRPEWQHRYPPGTTRNLEHVFIAELQQRLPVTLEPAEHLAFEWVPPQQALTTLWSETNRKALQQFVLPRLSGTPIN